jgi:predicted metal-binding protein
MTASQACEVLIFGQRSKEKTGGVRPLNIRRRAGLAGAVETAPGSPRHAECATCVTRQCALSEHVRLVVLSVRCADLKLEGLILQAWLRLDICRSPWVVHLEVGAVRDERDAGRHWLILSIIQMILRSDRVGAWRWTARCLRARAAVVVRLGGHAQAVVILLDTNTEAFVLRIGANAKADVRALAAWCHLARRVLELVLRGHARASTLADTSRVRLIAGAARRLSCNLSGLFVRNHRSFLLPLLHAHPSAFADVLPDHRVELRGEERRERRAHAEPLLAPAAY